MERESKKFLNLYGQHSIACIFTRIKRTDSDDSTHSNVVFQMTDCTKAITLNFDLNNPDARMNSVAKAKLLTEELNKFTEAILDEAKFAQHQHAIRVKSHLERLKSEEVTEHSQASILEYTELLRRIENEEI